MKKVLGLISLICLLSVWASAARAAGTAAIYLSPEIKNVEAGGVFGVNVLVDPRGQALDTVRAVIKYPHDKLKVVNFSLGDLYPTAAPGNFIDEAQGLISQGGTILGKQVNQAGIFGTIIFQALDAGRVTIALTRDSRLIRSGQEKIDSNHLGRLIVNIAPAQARALEPIRITSFSHPISGKWYNQNTVQLSWQIRDDKVVAMNYYLVFNTDPETDPSVAVGQTASQTFEKVADGLWYLHVKAQLTDKTFTSVVHFPVRIDTIPPRAILPALEKSTVRQGESTLLRFATTDQPSGIDYYDVAVDQSGFSRQTSPYRLSGLSAGEHIIFVRAVDKASNVSSNVVKLIVRPDILAGKDWPKYVLIGFAVVFLVGFCWFVAKHRRR